LPQLFKLKKNIMPLKVGDKAPDFTLYSSDKQPVSLHDYHGKNVVILFFPLAFTATCTKELCGVRDRVYNFDGLNAEVLAISVDTPQTLAKWKELEHYDFTMLSDFNKVVSKLYDSQYETFSVDLHGVAKRAAFLVDADGIIQYAEVLEDAGKIPDMDAIREKLQELEVA
jgi:glutaredoxin-dependent peroxiredoxin